MCKYLGNEGGGYDRDSEVGASPSLLCLKSILVAGEEVKYTQLGYQILYETNVELRVAVNIQANLSEGVRGGGSDTVACPQFVWWIAGRFLALTAYDIFCFTDQLAGTKLLCGRIS